MNRRAWCCISHKNRWCLCSHRILPASLRSRAAHGRRGVKHSWPLSPYQLVPSGPQRTLVIHTLLNAQKGGTKNGRSFLSGYVILAKSMLKPRHSHLWLIALVLLLGVQLTGLSCLGEWQGAIQSAQAEMVDSSPSPEGNVLDHGCPCHFVFQSVFLPLPEILSPRTDNVSSSPMLYVPTFVVFLFHPPLSV